MKRKGTKGIVKKAAKIVKMMGKDLNKSPVGRAARGKRARGYW